jgi:hypothetical protein
MACQTKVQLSSLAFACLQQGGPGSKKEEGANVDKKHPK